MSMKASNNGGVLVVDSDFLFEEIQELKRMMKTLLEKTQGQPAASSGVGWMKKSEACAYMKMSTAEFYRKRKKGTADFPFEQRQTGPKSFIYRPKPGY